MKSKNWSNLKSYLIPIISIIFGSLALIFQRINALSEKDTISVILTLIILLITTELIERKKRLSSIEEKLEDFQNSIFEKTEIARVKTIFKREDALKYIKDRTQKCNFSIDQASIDRKMNRVISQERKQYDKIRDQIIKKDRLQYRYLGMLYNERRLNFVRQHLEKSNLNNFFAGLYVKTQEEHPFMNFVIFDKKHIIARYPFTYGKTAEYIVIESSEAAKLFLGYFDKLWDESKKIKTIEDCNELLEQLK